jgi:hypothetical protein
VLARLSRERERKEADAKAKEDLVKAANAAEKEKKRLAHKAAVEKKNAEKKRQR